MAAAEDRLKADCWLLASRAPCAPARIVGLSTLRAYTAPREPRPPTACALPPRAQRAPPPMSVHRTNGILLQREAPASMACGHSLMSMSADISVSRRGSQPPPDSLRLYQPLHVSPGLSASPRACFCAHSCSLSRRVAASSSLCTCSSSKHAMRHALYHAICTAPCYAPCSAPCNGTCSAQCSAPMQRTCFSSRCCASLTSCSSALRSSASFCRACSTSSASRVWAESLACPPSRSRCRA